MGFNIAVSESQIVTLPGWILFLLVEVGCYFLAWQFYRLARQWNGEAPLSLAMEIMTNGKPKQHLYVMSAAMFVFGVLAFAHQIRIYWQTY